MIEYTIHPAAAIFPMMTEAELDALTADIKANGLKQPIVRMGDVILDGRNRLEACTRANVIPRYQEVEPQDPIAFVVSANIHRRHLTTQQRAAIAAELANLGRGGNNNPSGINQHGGQKEVKLSNDVLTDTPPVTIAEAAELMGVGTASVSRAKATMRDNPEAHEAAKRGERPQKSQKQAKKKEKEPEPDVNKFFCARAASDEYELLTGRRINPSNIYKKFNGILSEKIEWYSKIDRRAPITEAQYEQIRRVVREHIEATETPERLKERAKDVAERLSQSDKEKLEDAIRLHKRIADNEFEAKVTAEVSRQLDKILPRYSEEYAQYERFNSAWRGVFTHQQYKMLLGFLHPDRNPGDPEKAATLFRLVKENEDTLCGLKEREGGPKQHIPQTAAELMARRKMN